MDTSTVKRWLAPGWEQMQARQVVSADDYDALASRLEAELKRSRDERTALHARLVGERDSVQVELNRMIVARNRESENLDLSRRKVAILGGAWARVCRAFDAAVPGWWNRGASAGDAAVEWIRVLANAQQRLANLATKGREAAAKEEGLWWNAAGGSRAARAGETDASYLDRRAAAVLTAAINAAGDFDSVGVAGPSGSVDVYGPSPLASAAETVRNFSTLAGTHPLPDAPGVMPTLPLKSISEPFPSMAGVDMAKGPDEAVAFCTACSTTVTNPAFHGWGTCVERRGNPFFSTRRKRVGVVSRRSRMSEFFRAEGVTSHLYVKRGPSGNAFKATRNGPKERRRNPDRREELPF